MLNNDIALVTVDKFDGAVSSTMDEVVGLYQGSGVTNRLFGMYSQRPLVVSNVTSTATATVGEG